jgi:hypothetical protein
MTSLLNGTTDRVQLPTDGSGKYTAYKAVTLNSVTIYLPVAVLHDDAGNSIDSAAATLTSGGTERGLVTRPAGVTHVDDNAGSLTVDAPLGTPVGVRLSDGTTSIGSTAQRLHVDDGGSSISVDDNAGTLTVDAAVTAPLGVRLSDGTNALDTSTASLALAGTERGIVTRAAGQTNVAHPDTTATGTITTTDIVVAAPAGASTAGSLVSVATTGGDSSWTVQVTGLTSGTLYFEESLDSTTGTDGNWVNVNARRSGVRSTVLTGSATANGVYRGNLGGMKYFRVRSVGALTGTPAISIRVSDGEASTFLNADLPTWTSFHLISAATTNATVVKATPGSVNGWFIQNANASARYVKFHNSATTPTAGSGVVWTVGVPGGGAANVFAPGGVYFSTGIAITTTTGITDADAVAVALSDLNINLAYT